MKYLSVIENMSVRSGHGVDCKKIGSHPVDAEDLEVVSLWVSDRKEMYHLVGDTWAQTPIGWIAVVHLGRTYGYIVEKDVEPPPPPTDGLNITEIISGILRNGGCIASLKHDYDCPEYNYAPRKKSKQDTYPETVQFNDRPRAGKGSKIKLTSWMRRYIESINTPEANTAWKTPKAGLINSGHDPEALSFGGNFVVVKSVSGKYANVWAVPTSTVNLTDTWFTPNGRFAIMKMTAITQGRKIVKIGKGLDIYIPFLSNQSDYYVPISRLEFWHRTPFALSNGAIIDSYLTLGDDIFGVTNGGDRICLYSPRAGWTTNWRLGTIPPPPHG